MKNAAPPTPLLQASATAKQPQTCYFAIDESKLSITSNYLIIPSKVVLEEQAKGQYSWVTFNSRQYFPVAIFKDQASSTSVGGDNYSSNNSTISNIESDLNSSSESSSSTSSNSINCNSTSKSNSNSSSNGTGISKSDIDRIIGTGQQGQQVNVTSKINIRFELLAGNPNGAKNMIHDKDGLENYMARTANVSQRPTSSKGSSSSQNYSVQAHSNKGVYWVQSFKLHLPGTLRVIITTEKDVVRDERGANHYTVRPLVLDIPILDESGKFDVSMEDLMGDDDDIDDKNNNSSSNNKNNCTLQKNVGKSSSTAKRSISATDSGDGGRDEYPVTVSEPGRKRSAAMIILKNPDEEEQQKQPAKTLKSSIQDTKEISPSTSSSNKSSQEAIDISRHQQAPLSFPGYFVYSLEATYLLLSDKKEKMDIISDEDFTKSCTNSRVCNIRINVDKCDELEMKVGIDQYFPIPVHQELHSKYRISRPRVMMSNVSEKEKGAIIHEASNSSNSVDSSIINAQSIQSDMEVGGGAVQLAININSSPILNTVHFGGPMLHLNLPNCLLVALMDNKARVYQTVEAFHTLQSRHQIVFQKIGGLSNIEGEIDPSSPFSLTKLSNKKGASAVHTSQKPLPIPQLEFLTKEENVPSVTELLHRARLRFDGGALGTYIKDDDLDLYFRSLHSMFELYCESYLMYPHEFDMMRYRLEAAKDESKGVLFSDLLGPIYLLRLLLLVVKGVDIPGICHSGSDGTSIGGAGVSPTSSSSSSDTNNSRNDPSPLTLPSIGNSETNIDIGVDTASMSQITFPVSFTKSQLRRSNVGLKQLTYQVKRFQEILDSIVLDLYEYSHLLF